MLRKIVLIFCFVLALHGQNVAAQDVSGQLKSELGLHQITFAFPQGNIVVYLPDDMAAGDKVAGVVLASSRLKLIRTQKEVQEHNRVVAGLNNYVIEFEKQRAKVGAAKFSWNVPAALAGKPAAVVVKDKAGKEITKVSVPVAPKADRPATSDFEVPTMAQQGKTVEVRGNFDANFTNTVVMMGGQELSKLAESPRKVIARNISSAIGLTDIEIEEGKQKAKSEIRSIGIRLSAPKASLKIGERTTMKFAVLGLEGIKEALPIEFENQSTNLVSMQGGELQKFTLSPGQVLAGKYTTERTLTGVRPGEYLIVAKLGEIKTATVKSTKRK